MKLRAWMVNYFTSSKNPRKKANWEHMESQLKPVAGNRTWITSWHPQKPGRDIWEAAPEGTAFQIFFGEDSPLISGTAFFDENLKLLKKSYDDFGPV